METLYRHYHTILIETLKKLKYPKDIPSFEDLKNEIQKKGFHGMYTMSGFHLLLYIFANNYFLILGLTTLICFTAVFFNEHKEYADAVNFISDSEECEQIRSIVFNNPEFGNILAENLPIFVKNGHF